VSAALHQTMRLALSLSLLLPLAAPAADFGPFPTAVAPVTREARAPGPTRAASLDAGHFLHLGFRFYQRVVSPIDGARCHHTPTCSRFALDAVQQKGFLLGVLLTVDRLWNTGRSSALRLLPEVWTRAGYRFFDPVAQETFWLEGRLGPESWLLPPRDQELDR